MSNTDFIKPINSKSTVEYIVNELINTIIDGIWKPGSKIPTEVELAEAFGVGRNSVREAIKVLVALGLLTIKRSDGTYVANKFSEKMLNPLIYSFALDEGTNQQLADLKKIFHLGSTELAIHNATDKDILLLEESYQTFRTLLLTENPSPDILLNADINFHNTISQITHNIFVSRISYVIERIGRPQRLRDIEYVISIHEIPFLIDSHFAILQIIKNRDIDKVREVVLHSFKYSKMSFEENVTSDDPQYTTKS